MEELKRFKQFLAEGQINEVNKQVERFPKERSTPIVSRGKAFIKDLGPRTTAADIKTWVDDNFKNYAIKGDDKGEVLKTLIAYNDAINGLGEGKEKMNEAALSNQEIVTKVIEFINGPLAQLRKEVYAWYESIDPESKDSETAFYLRYALSEANKEIKKAFTGVRRMK